MKNEDKILWELHLFDCHFCDQGSLFSQNHIYLVRYGRRLTVCRSLSIANCPCFISKDRSMVSVSANILNSLKVAFMNFVALSCFITIIVNLVSLRIRNYELTTTVAHLTVRHTNFVQHFAFESMQLSASPLSEDLIFPQFLISVF